MTHRPALAAAAALLLASPAYAQAVPGAGTFYAGGAFALQLFNDNEVGVVDIEFDPGFAFGGFAGYKVGNLRFEGEIGYQAADFDFSIGGDGELSVLRYTGSLLLDIPTLALPVVPHVGGGIGLASVEVDSAVDDDETAFTWHVEAGAALRMTPQLDLVPSYRYEWTDVDIGDDILTAHVLRVAARLNF
jgi:opacity protein-like surface antigen